MREGQRDDEKGRENWSHLQQCSQGSLHLSSDSLEKAGERMRERQRDMKPGVQGVVLEDQFMLY